jgi:hypothetical protein
LGVFALVVATGAGAGARRSIGLPVFSGMIASTCLVVVYVPSFYVVMQRTQKRWTGRAARNMRRRRLIIQRARLRAASRAGSNLAYIDVRESERQGQLSLELKSCGVHCSEKSSLMTEMGHKQPRAINRRTRHFHSTSS